MRQPGDLIADDRSDLVFHGRSSKRPYLAAVPLIAALVVVAGIGALGPRPGSRSTGQLPGGPDQASASDSNEGTAQASAPDPSPSWLVVGSTPEPYAELAPNVGLARLEVGDGSIRSSEAPAGYPSIAFSGHQVFVGTGADVTRIDFDETGAPELIASMDPGYVVGALATTGTKVIVLEAPLPEVCGDTGCPTTAGPDWEVLILNPDGSDGRIAETFPQSSGVDRLITPLLAAADGQWAVSRPDLRPGHTGSTVIEVHSDSGQLLWSTSTRSDVLKLTLGGSRLAAVLGDPSEGESRSVAVADAAHRDLAPGASVSWDASISPDGRYMAWDSGGCVVTQDGIGNRQVCPPDDRSETLRAFADPSVGTWGNGPMTVWAIDTLDGHWLGISAPAALANDVWLANGGSPSWFGVQGSLLVWASFTKTGIEIHEVDLSIADLTIG
jgi:hypothetical protein